MTDGGLLAAVFLWLLFTLPPRPAITAAPSAAIRARRSPARFTCTASARMVVAAAPRSLPRPRGPACGSSSSRTTAMRPAPRSPGLQSRRALSSTPSNQHQWRSFVALDMPAAPYPLGGEAAAVVEDIVRLGGMPVIAHPDSPKPELAWGAWSAPAGGVEWLNLDSAWRDEPFGRPARIAVGSFFRPAPALAVTLARPAEPWPRGTGSPATVR